MQVLAVCYPPTQFMLLWILDLTVQNVDYCAVYWRTAVDVTLSQPVEITQAYAWILSPD